MGVGKFRVRKNARRGKNLRASATRIACLPHFAAPHIFRYVSKKFFTQRSITSHLVAVFWQLSGMASCSISWDEIWVFRGALDACCHTDTGHSVAAVAVPAVAGQGRLVEGMGHESPGRGAAPGQTTHPR